MKELFSKLSLYDILVMLIPGGAILVFIALSFNFKLEFNHAKMAPALSWTIMLTLAYIIGIVNHIATNVLWSWFRNNPYMISRAGVRKGISGVGKINYGCLRCFVLLIVLLFIPFIIWFTTSREYVWCFETLVCVLPLIYLVLLILDLTLSPIKLKCKKSNVKCRIFTCFKRVCLLLKVKKKRSEIILEKYYEHYYTALKSRYSNDIPIMEGQVAFMQSMIIPLLLLTLLPHGVLCDYIPCGYECCVRLLLISLIVLLILAIILRQRKIYERVWEDAKFFKLLQQNEKNSKKIIYETS